MLIFLPIYEAGISAVAGVCAGLALLVVIIQYTEENNQEFWSMAYSSLNPNSFYYPCDLSEVTKTL